MVDLEIIRRAQIDAAERVIIDDFRKRERQAINEKSLPEIIVVVKGITGACLHKLRDLLPEHLLYPIIKENDFVMVWSFEHDAWWRPDHCGYTNEEEQAGLYPRKEAEEICRKANHNSLNEEIVEIEPDLKKQIRELIEEINRQDNRATAFPYYFAVQELEWMPDPEGYNWGEEQREIVVIDDCCYCKKTYRETVNEELDGLLPISDEAFDELWEKDKQTQTGVWITKGVFLTEIAANRFIEANAHNYGKMRTYVKHFYRNSQMELVFKALEAFAETRIKRR